VCLQLLSLFESAHAQTSIIARATSVTGAAVLSTAGSPQFALSRGYLLNPGDLIDTRGGGRVVIDLSDGSIVIVQPESVVTLKDFHTADSLRELFEVTIGRVRVKINHFGGRPNPYRINTPTASIAVRGTEFSIAVDNAGDTRVDVYEGAVQVSSLANPNQTVLLEAGRGVLVVPGQDFNFFNAQGANDLASNHDNDRSNSTTASASPDGHSGEGSVPLRSDRDDVSPRTTADTYERYINNLWEVGQVPFLLRYNAFAESHLDSLENPAYASVFQSAEARLYLVPTVAGTPGAESAEALGEGGERPPGYGMSSQATMFLPIPGSQFVVGGSITSSRLSNGIQGLAPNYSLGLLGSTSTNGADISNFVSGSIVGARRLGTRSSVGISIEHLYGNGSLFKTAIAPDASVPNAEQISSASTISQT
jgi:FecR-like protein